jgi:hypothetical protein
MCAEAVSRGKGRPTSYEDDFVDQAYKLALLGATDKQTADFFGVDESTLNRWKLRHGDFCASIKKGKMAADAEVAESLYHRARGYSHPDTKIFCHEGEIITADTVKHYPPDTAAAFIWLKNRAGWTDKTEEVRRVEHTIKFDEAERKALAAIGDKLLGLKYGKTD